VGVDNPLNLRGRQNLFPLAGAAVAEKSLLTGASVVALAAASPNASAADMAAPMAKKAPPAPAAVVKDRWSWWIEGGAFGSGGGDVNFAGPVGLKPNLGRGRRDWIRLAIGRFCAVAF
jgi:hypothetical protein